MNTYRGFTIIVLCFSFAIFEVKAWDSDELEIFDLVEEINENFYSLLGIKQDAKLQEVKRAFRNLSVILHPDKNSAEDANVKFRNLVSVYEVLKDSGKREKYDAVLKNGLPNWRSAVYYYRHVRKMGLVEMTIILFVLITIGQYIVGWAVYSEKKRTAEKLLGAKMKKSLKRNKMADSSGGANNNSNVDTMLSSILAEIPTPSVRDTLPCQLVRFVWNLPRNVRRMRAEMAEQKRLQEEQIQRELEEQERLERAQLEYEKAKENRGPRRRKPLFRPPEMTDEDYQLLLSNQTATNSNSKGAPMPKPRPVITGGLWTDDDIAELTRLVKKYPGGTPDRWERIADMMNRSVPEITHMSAKIKENCYRMAGQEDGASRNENGITVDIMPELPRKVKTKGGKLGEITLSDNFDNDTATSTGTSDSSDVNNTASNIEISWSQEQQRALENALQKYPKKGGERWEKISKCVPGKTKEDCILRYKYLVELVKRQTTQCQKDTSESNTVVSEDATNEKNSSELKSDVTEGMVTS